MTVAPNVPEPVTPTKGLRMLQASVAAAGDRFKVAGLDINVLRFDEALDYLLSAPRAGRQMRVHFCAVNTLVEASRNPQLRESLNQADVLAPDGMPVVWAGRVRGKSIERVCGPDTMPALLDRSRAHGYSHFFYGSTPETVEELANRMRARFPGLEVAGVYSPPFRPLEWSEVEAVVDMINDSCADYVWVGLGSPKQDEWLADFRPLLRAPVLLAVGAAFDFHAGTLRRAPRWAQRSGLEWIFRLCAEPKRLFWRYSATNLRFMRLLLADVLGRGEAHA